MAFSPSIQQKTFFDWISGGKGSCVLEAVAGSGKTTTLVEALGLMKGYIFFGAYNKKIADEIAGRVPPSQFLTVSTMHAAGFRAWRKVAPKVKVDGDKLRNLFRELTFRDMEYGLLENPVLQLVSYGKQAGIGILKDHPIDSDIRWLELIEHFNVEVFSDRGKNSGKDQTRDIIRLAKDVLTMSVKANKDVIDFEDMIFAPLFHNVSFFQFNWVLLDEAQDTNVTRRLLALKLLKPGGRLVAVGDRHQAIYGFTGADANSLDLIREATKAVCMPLTTSYRCPKAVVAYAQQWVKHIQAHENAPEGQVLTGEISHLKDLAKVGDVVLCRFNAPLIKYVYTFIAAGIPARVEGRDIGAGLKNLAKRWKIKSLTAFSDRLIEWSEKEIKNYREKEENVKAQTLEDRVECMKVIISRVQSKDPHAMDPCGRIIEEIDEIFGKEDDRRPVVLFSSIHRSKGREWNNVVWLQTGPSGWAKLPWELEQEDNLCYVAPTRAKKTLINIDIRTGPAESAAAPRA